MNPHLILEFKTMNAIQKAFDLAILDTRYPVTPLAVVADKLIMKQKDFKSGWNAKLSYRTHQQLQKEGYVKFSG